MSRYAAVALVGVIVLAVVGCKGAATPRAVAAQYLGYMKAEKYDAAAKLWDYDTEARKQNDEWDSIQEGQRALIKDKLAVDKANSLKLWTGYFPAAAKISAVQESGDTAFAEIEGGRVGRLNLAKVDEEWRITGMN